MTMIHPHKLIQLILLLGLLINTHTYAASPTSAPTSSPTSPQPASPAPPKPPPSAAATSSFSSGWVQKALKQLPPTKRTPLLKALRKGKTNLAQAYTLAQPLLTAPKNPNTKTQRPKRLKLIEYEYKQLFAHYQRAATLSKGQAIEVWVVCQAARLRDDHIKLTNRLFPIGARALYWEAVKEQAKKSLIKRGVPPRFLSRLLQNKALYKKLQAITDQAYQKGLDKHHKRMLPLYKRAYIAHQRCLSLQQKHKLPSTQQRTFRKRQEQLKAQIDR